MASTEVNGTIVLAEIITSSSIKSFKITSQPFRNCAQISDFLFTPGDIMYHEILSLAFMDLYRGCYRFELENTHIEIKDG